MRRLAFVVMLGCGTKDPVATDAGVDAAPLPSRGGAVTVVVGSYTVQEKTFGETTVDPLTGVRVTPAQRLRSLIDEIA